MQKNTIMGIPSSESLIINFLWQEEGGKSFREIMDFLENQAGKKWAKQTVNTLLKRLINKNLVRAETAEKNKVYYAALTQKEYETVFAKKVLSDFYDGSISKFLSALTGGQNIDSDFAEQLRELVEKNK